MGDIKVCVLDIDLYGVVQESNSPIPINAPVSSLHIMPVTTWSTPHPGYRCSPGYVGTLFPRRTIDRLDCFTTSFKFYQWLSDATIAYGSIPLGVHCRTYFLPSVCHVRSVRFCVFHIGSHVWFRAVVSVPQGTGELADWGRGRHAVI